MESEVHDGGRFAKRTDIRGGAASKYVKHRNKRLQYIETKDMLVQIADFEAAFKKNLQPIDSKLAEIEPVTVGGRTDNYEFSEQDTILIYHSEHDDKLFVKRIQLNGTDLKMFAKLQKALIKTVYPKMTDTEYKQVDATLQNFKDSDSGRMKNVRFKRSWSEHIHKNKYMSLIRFIREANDQLPEMTKLTLEIQPE